VLAKIMLKNLACFVFFVWFYWSCEDYADCSHISLICCFIFWRHFAIVTSLSFI